MDNKDHNEDQKEILSPEQIQEFRQKLRSACPDISDMQMEVAVWVRQKFKDYEIVPILHINERTVETHRRRLRKKLHLEAIEKLFVFMKSL